ncbi:hypothetical protein [Halomonas sp. KO116]|uniref:hypothetical protein n=1 Tax=Halomonas sp. KO116 TaxID=1504981 RepID=UPI000552DBF5|nr:hypothetical protein [Halomonas sp. KO116]
MLTNTHEKAQRNGWAFSAPPSTANAKPENSTRYGARLCRVDRVQPLTVIADAKNLSPVSGKGAA